jgi:hypothetical protein
MARPASDTPALETFLVALREAIEDQLPVSVVHAGMTYAVRLRAAVGVAVFEEGAPSSGRPLFQGAVFVSNAPAPKP